MNYKEYSPDWRDIIRPRALMRAQYKCQELGCLVKHKQIGYYDARGNWIECDEFQQAWAKTQKIKLQKIYLQVAHLDQNPANNSDSNLKAFCPQHHFAYDRFYNNIKRIAKFNK
tara:strand:+ start:429 stop:770 length:342 start_codon:yes stop_codon:yes gene_type:complete